MLDVCGVPVYPRAESEKGSTVAFKKSRVLKFLASIELGVIIIVIIAALTAWGTFVEAKYNDPVAAKKLVYHSVWMYSALIALAISLISVMVDRWPWREKHIGFVLAHLGIVILLIGSVLTRYFGLDGTMSLAVGQSSQFVLNEDTVIAAYASLGDDSGFRKVGEAKVDFFLNRPTAEKPFELPLAGGSVYVIDYYPYAFREEKIVESSRENAGAGIRFQLQNDRVSLTQWLVQPASGRDVSKNLGPAEVILTQEKVTPPKGRNVLVLRPQGDVVEYEIHTAREPGKVKRGRVRSGDTVDTGWMGLVLRILKYVPRAEEQISFKPTEAATPMTMAAIKLKYQGQEYWVGENSMLKLFTDQAVYILTYGRTRTDIGFPVTLKDFRIGRYPGSMRAASYESVVEVPGVGERVISMNAPLYHNGYTFYQASFSEDEEGRPTISVFSVNWDPGRWFKYLGSALIVLGSIHLFYFKQKTKRRNAKAEAQSAA